VSSVGSLSDWLAKQMAIQEGWGQDGIRAVPLGAVEISIAALKARQVDAVVLSTEAGFGLEERGQGRMLASMDRYAPHFITHVVFAQKSLVANKPETVRRFLKGFFAAIAFMKTHRDETSGLAERVLHQSAAVVGKDYDFEAGMFIDDGRFDAQAVAALKQSFIDMERCMSGRRTTCCSPRNSCRSSRTGINQTMTTATTPITNPNVTRSRLVLEIASEMAGGAAADAVPDYILPKVVLQHSRGGKPVTFSGVSSAEGISRWRRARSISP